MEFSPRVVLTERLLVAVFLTALVCTAGWESRSAVSWAVRRDTPYVFRLSLGGSAFWAAYGPVRQTLDLVYLPNAAAEAGLPPTAGTLSLAAPALARGEEPMAAADWLGRALRGAGFWTRLLPAALGAGGGDLPLQERLILALELRRIPAEGLRPSWLPDEPGRQAFVARLLEPAESPEGPGALALTVEVLNGTLRKGLASEATKVLRLRGADVVRFGNTEAPAPRTVVFDRTGRVENAFAVRAMLGCRGAGVVTQIDPKTLVDVSVLVAEDCAVSEAKPGR